MEADAGGSTAISGSGSLSRPDLRHLPQAFSTDDPRRIPFMVVMGSVLVVAIVVDATGVDLRSPTGRRTHVGWDEVPDVQVGAGLLPRNRVVTPRGAVPLHGMPRRAVRELREHVSR